MTSSSWEEINSWWALCTKWGVRGERNRLFLAPDGAAGTKVVLCKVTAAPAAPQVACFIYLYKKGALFNLWTSSYGVGGMPGSLREDPRAAGVAWGSVGTVLPFLWLLHLMLQAELPEMGPGLGRQKAGEGREERAGRRLEMIWISSYIHHTCLLIANKEQKFNTQGSLICIIFPWL